MVTQEITATQEEIVEALRETTEKLTKMLTLKGQDYSGKKDTFSNFKLSSALLDIPVEKVILSRMGDKLSRMASLIKNGEVGIKSESIYDTIEDLIGYSILLKTYLYKKEVTEIGNIAKEIDSTEIRETKTPDINNLENSDYYIVDDDGEID